MPLFVFDFGAGGGAGYNNTVTTVAPMVQSKPTPHHFMYRMSLSLCAFHAGSGEMLSIGFLDVPLYSAALVAFAYRDA